MHIFLSEVRLKAEEKYKSYFFLYLGFTSCEAEHMKSPLQGMEVQEKVSVNSRLKAI